MANTNNFKRLNKREYAAIATAKENARKIAELTAVVLAKGGVTKAYAAIKEIAEINGKWAADFGELKLGAWGQAAAPAAEAAVETEPEKG